MGWNYRLIKTQHQYGGDTYHSYAIHEVYYDKDGHPNAWTKNAITLEGFEDFNDGFQSMKLMQKAFEKPVLELLTDEIGEEYLQAMSVFNQIGGSS